MTGAVEAEFAKLRTRRSLQVLIAAWLFLVVFIGYIIPYAILMTEDVRGSGRDALVDLLLPQQATGNFLGSVPLFGFATALILGATSYGSEYAFKTLPTLFTQMPSRLQVHAAKQLALALCTGILSLLGYCIAFVAAQLVASQLSASSSAPAWGTVALGLLASWLIMALGAALGSVLAVLSRSTTLAVGLGLGYAVVFESAFAGLSGAASWMRSAVAWLPVTNATALSDLFQGKTQAALDADAVVSLGAGRSTGLVAFYLVVSTVAAALVLGRRDVV